MGDAPTICRDCGATIPPTLPGHIGGTGYARDGEGRAVCYACCGLEDQAHIRANDRITLYLVQKADAPTRARGVLSPGDWEVTNWPGSLRIPVSYIGRGAHNMARTRLDVNFTGPDGAQWHGVQYGNNSQVCHCRRLKVREVRRHAHA